MRADCSSAAPSWSCFRRNPSPYVFPATTVDTLWTRGNAAKTGAIVGAVILGHSRHRTWSLGGRGVYGS